MLSIMSHPHALVGAAADWKPADAVQLTSIPMPSYAAPWSQISIMYLHSIHVDAVSALETLQCIHKTMPVSQDELCTHGIACWVFLELGSWFSSVAYLRVALGGYRAKPRATKVLRPCIVA